jgi:predicted metal-dependent phosphoesterase TrpH
MGLSGLAITDHDTTLAYDTAVAAAKEVGILLGTGIEFSCEFEGTSLHLLGYDYLLHSPAVEQLCIRHRKRRLERNRAILAELKKQGMPIEEEEIFQNHVGNSVGRPHIAQAMVRKAYVGSIREAFHRYLGEGEKCYVAGEPFAPEEAIGALHEAKGKAFIAHPHLIPKGMPLGKILELPFDGIECFYARFPKNNCDKWLQIAEKKGWLISGGSDFHGDSKPDAPLGSSFVDRKVFDSLFQNLP